MQTNWLVYPTAMVFVLSVLCAVVGVARVWRDARRPSNGIWITAAGLLLWLTAVIACLSIESADVPTWLIAAVLYPVLGVVVLSLVLAAFLMVNTIVVTRRERLHLATLVPFGIGALIVAMHISWVLQFVALVASDTPQGWWVVVLLPIVAAPGLVLLFELVAYTGYALFYSQVRGGGTADVIVVLGSGLSGDQVTPLLASRLDAGIAAFERCREAGSDATIVVSGGKGSDESRSEAAAMAEYLEDKGLPSDRIIEESSSTTTRENLEYTVALLAENNIPWTTMAIATSNFHVLRAVSLARMLEIPSVPVGAPTAAYYLPSAFLREFAATVVHFRRGTTLASLAVMVCWLALSWYALTLMSGVLADQSV
jgi:uncharacterized SAM-binding protein YcdF (DUF218 family)